MRPAPAFRAEAIALASFRVAHSDSFRLAAHVIALGLLFGFAGFGLGLALLCDP